VSIHPGGHVAGTQAHGVGHAASHGPVHASTHTAGTIGTANEIQTTVQSVLGYVNITSIVFFLFGFGLFGYILHNATALLLPLTLTLAGSGGLVFADLLLGLLSRLFGASEGATM